MECMNIGGLLEQESQHVIYLLNLQTHKKHDYLLTFTKKIQHWITVSSAKPHFNRCPGFNMAGINSRE